jgi:hypothetical protein
MPTEQETQARIDVALKNARQQWEASTASQQGLADIGRSVLNELRHKGTAVPYVIDEKQGSMFAKIASKYIRMGKDFDTLMTAVKRDFTLNSEWERFCMMLRLAEGSDDQED